MTDPSASGEPPETHDGRWYLVAYSVGEHGAFVGIGRVDMRIASLPVTFEEVEERLDPVLTEALRGRGKIGALQDACVIGWTALGGDPA
jgi:hypothetical protein